jgi:hypothetical protein
VEVLLSRTLPLVAENGTRLSETGFPLDSGSQASQNVHVVVVTA